MRLLWHGLDTTQIADLRIITSLREHWSIIWQWSDYLLRTYVLDKSGMDSDQEKAWQDVHWATMSLFSIFIHVHGFCTLMVNTRGLIKLLSQVWKLEEDIIPENPISASNSLMTLFPPNQREFTWRNLFVASLEVPHEEVARMVLLRIIRSSTKPPVGCAPISGDLGMAMSCTRLENVHRAMLAKDAIFIIADVMARLTSPSATHLQPAPAGQCLLYCSQYLQCCFGTDGFSWVLRALEARLLVTIFKSARLLFAMRDCNPGRDYIGDQYASLLNTIAPFLIYRPILRQAVKSLKVIDRLGLTARMPTTGSFADTWAIFRDFVESRAQFKIQYDEVSKKGVDTSFCANRTVRIFYSVLRITRLLITGISTASYDNYDSYSPLETLWRLLLCVILLNQLSEDCLGEWSQEGMQAG